MQILVNDKNEITDYVLLGQSAGGIEVANEALPDNFFDTFKPKCYLYKDGQISLNGNWVDPNTISKSATPTADQQAITAMAQQMDDQQQHIASLEQALTALAQGGAKS
ncbi:DUF2977 domain-containing protein [Lactiplantibacillus pentosus]|uniref:DUF2977 domain-containing protein n=1 Tax=Lactiplantibacillus pentosus TaxID=1589 RepID=UPI001CD7D191|nr:DUF2977 domain-containing protein [Lactiplantibacillus pentosus]MCA1341529.1 DUF2977 domain-containing protein [Lactiplantibacillus pentosus]